MQHALHVPLRPNRWCLSEAEHFYPEAEFIYSEPPHFIKGFIDLIFEIENKIYVIDWKTNLLPSYDKKALDLAMLDQDYYLQAALYQTALQRYLKGRSYGGTYYIFLRGLPNEGIIFLSPEEN